ncbi:MAG: NADH-quinone oxidoreductase subunit A [Omnitrophica bacterium RIFCSPHIGHO2_02_FULL_46_11]|nr:MAG: NADH-quinone oxidoreductase subunit A [Omnitrophica bacterium RIFCSPHIGHO2_02_FULL_46_11]
MRIGTYEYQYLFLGIFLLIAIAFPLLPIILARFIAPKKPNPIKTSSYECGMEAKGDSWVQFKAQYYIYALIFVIFDIEVIFIYPWAVAFKQMGLFAFIEMVIFLAILGFGLIYAWKKRVLEWK